MIKYSKITGTGSYLPATVFTNQDWEKQVETSHEWIVDRTGIHSRRFASPEETASSMAEVAAKRAMEMAGISAQEIDLIIVATGTPDKIFPSTACLLQKRLGVKNGPAFDIQAACSGFMYALNMADMFIRSGGYQHVLVIGAEIMSRLIDWKDRETCVLFGDGAGAVIVKASDTPGILGVDLYADGAYEDILYVGKNALSQPQIFMQGRAVFKLAVTMLEQMVYKILKKHNITADEIDWLIPHQANFRIIKATADKLDLPMDKVVCTVQDHANTSSASIPLALDVAVRDGRVKPGQLVLMEAFGAGMTCGAALVRF